MALSGIRDRQEVIAFQKKGVKGILVGETLMKSSAVVDTIQVMMCFFMFLLFLVK